MVVALLAVLKAGAAYVPLDHTDPRLTDMLADARVPVLLTQKHLAGLLPPGGWTLVCADAEWRSIAGGP